MSEFIDSAENTLDSIRKMMLDDLKKSGLTAANAEACHLEPCEVVVHLPAYRIPYFDLDGKPNGYYRIKLLVPYVNANGEAIEYLSPDDVQTGWQA